MELWFGLDKISIILSVRVQMRREAGTKRGDKVDDMIIWDSQQMNLNGPRDQWARERNLDRYSIHSVQIGLCRNLWNAKNSMVGRYSISS